MHGDAGADKGFGCDPGMSANADWAGDELKVAIVNIVRASAEMGSLRDECIFLNNDKVHTVTNYVRAQAGVFVHLQIGGYQILTPGYTLAVGAILAPKERTRKRRHE